MDLADGDDNPDAPKCAVCDEAELTLKRGRWGGRFGFSEEKEPELIRRLLAVPKVLTKPPALYSEQGRPARYHTVPG